MATNFFCGFESGDTTEALSTAGTLSVQGSVTRGAWSAYALRTNPATTGTGSARVGGRTATGIVGSGAATPAATFYARCYFRADTFPASASEEFLAVQNTSNAAKFALRVTSAGNIAAYDATPTLIATGTAVLSTGVWYRIELKVGTGVGAAVEWKVDGVTDVSTTASLSATNNGTVQFGKVTNRNGQSVDFYYDDALVSDSAYPGEGQSGVLKTNAAGNYQTFTRGGADSGNNWDQANDVPHNGDTDYLVSDNTIDHAETEGLEPASTLSISGTINCACAVAVVKRDSGAVGTVRPRLRSGATDSDTPNNFSTGASYVSVGKYFDTDPATAAAWATAGIDGAEVGAVEKSSGTKSRLTACHLLVDWTPSAGGSDVNGTLAVTLGALTCAASGTIAIAGTLAATLGALTCSATGTVAVAGSLSATLGALTCAATGTVAVTGSVAVTLGALTAAATAAVAVTGGVSANLGVLTVSASGTVAVAATLDVTLGSLTGTATATVAVSGALSATLGALTLSATGVTQGISGSLAATLGVLTLAATGTVLVPVPGKPFAGQGGRTFTEPGHGAFRGGAGRTFRG